MSPNRPTSPIIFPCKMVAQRWAQGSIPSFGSLENSQRTFGRYRSNISIRQIWIVDSGMSHANWVTRTIYGTSPKQSTVYKQTCRREKLTFLNSQGNLPQIFAGNFKNNVSAKWELANRGQTQVLLNLTRTRQICKRDSVENKFYSIPLTHFSTRHRPLLLIFPVIPWNNV